MLMKACMTISIRNLQLYSFQNSESLHAGIQTAAEIKVNETTIHQKQNNTSEEL